MRKDRLAGMIGIILGALLGIFAEEIRQYGSAHLWVLYLCMIILIILFFDVHSSILRRYHQWRRWKIPVKVGIMNGLVSNSKPKMRCQQANYKFEEWKDTLMSIRVDRKNKFKIFQMCAQQISDKYALIINPFGEIHFDENRRALPTFEKILRYIENGGVFVCTGGIPFYYVWHDVLGKPIDTTPKQVEVDVGQLRQFRIFSDTLYTREFGVTFNGRPSVSTKVYQRKEDVKIFGDLVLEGGSDLVYEFRSAEKDNVVPALRTIIDEKEMYPLYAVPYGKGYLLVAGMSLTTSGVEFKKMVKAISSLTDYLLERQS